MASDLVASRMEGMIPELEELQALKLFSKPEIKKIVRARSDFEYRMQRKSPNKIDFLRYIEYELNLEALRKARKRRLNIEKASKTDYACVRRVSHIYERLLRRFSGDLDMWFQYIDHLEKQKSVRGLRKIYAKALQLHPRNDRLWGRAAAFEFSMQQDIAAARILMQRGLRLNSSSVLLWVAFFTMEIRYVQKLLARRKLLGLKPVPDNLLEAEFLSGALPLAIHRNCMRNADLSRRVDLHESFLKAVPDPKPKYIGEHENSTDNQKAVRAFDDPFSKLRSQVVEEMKRQLGRSEAAWGLIAKTAFKAGAREYLLLNCKTASRDGKDGMEGGSKGPLASLLPERRALAVFEEALNKCPSADMYSRYVMFLRSRARNVGSNKGAKWLIKRLILICERASLSPEFGNLILLPEPNEGRQKKKRKKKIRKKLNPDKKTESSDKKEWDETSRLISAMSIIYCNWAETLACCGRTDEALSTLREAVAKVPQAPKPWQLLCDYCAKLGVDPKLSSLLENKKLKKRRKLGKKDANKQDVDGEALVDVSLEELYHANIRLLEQAAGSVDAVKGTELWKRLLLVGSAKASLSIKQTFQRSKKRKRNKLLYTNDQDDVGQLERLFTKAQQAFCKSYRNIYEDKKDKRDRTKTNGNESGTAGGDGEEDYLALMYLDWMFLAHGANLRYTLDAVKTVLKLRTFGSEGATSLASYTRIPSLSVHMQCLRALTSSMPQASSEDTMRTAEIAISRYGQTSPELWLWLVKFHLKETKENSAILSKICWRAEKCLKTEVARLAFQQGYKDLKMQNLASDNI
mmetsp:Transcript_11449/g.28191  ORF Transcript_11449/g.28191 Transcript_11449/m.28191 type:complete len:804 (-) Transcript_11449:173-2584(-)